jgi:cyclase
MNTPKFRIIPTILKRGPSVVKGKSFSKSRVFSPIFPVLKVFQSRDVDELCIIDVAPCHSSDDMSRFNWLRSAADLISMPLSVGGGIRNINQISQLISTGADKVILNTACRNDPNLVKESISRFGSQSLVASIDVLCIDNKYFVYDSWKQEHIEHDLFQLIDEVQSLNAGEILITSVNNEGHMNGLDLKLFNQISSRISIPLVFQGGASSLQHFEQITDFKSNISAIAAGACFHFTPITPFMISSHLKTKGINTRSPFISDD